MRPVIFTNSDIQGATVRSRITQATYVFDLSNPGNYRRETVPQGYRGILNGNVIVLLGDEDDSEPYRKLAAKSYDLRDLLTSSKALETLNLPPFQRDSAKRKLVLGSRMMLGVNWQHWGRSREYAHLIPWLELVAG